MFTEINATITTATAVTTTTTIPLTNININNIKCPNSKSDTAWFIRNLIEEFNKQICNKGQYIYYSLS